MRWRQNQTGSETLTADLSLELPVNTGALVIGFDGETVEKDARISNPNNDNFFLLSLPDITEGRLGGFAEWRDKAAGTHFELGVRYDAYDKSAGLAQTGDAVPMMPSNLANGFNNTARDWNADALDLVVRAWREVSKNTTLRGTLARKSRAPGYVEIFSWLPTQASGGLADGNIYVGSQSLDLETALIGEIGLDWQTQNAYARPIHLFQTD